MENYISICGQKINLTDEQVKQLKQSFGVASMKLSELPVKGTFAIGKHEFVVLSHSGNTTAAIRKDLLIEKSAFGKSNNYDGSDVDAICNKFAEEIAALIGKENLVEHAVDLTSDDGLKDYGKIRRLASLLTADMYRRYVEILDENKIKKWWWLATAYSTPAHEDVSWVKCVSPSGDIFNLICDYGLGVRPFCIFKSHIFVSK